MAGKPSRGRQGTGHRLRAAKGGRTDVGHGGRRSHAKRGAKTSDRGWWVAGVRKSQVEDVPCHERRWVAGFT